MDEIVIIGGGFAGLSSAVYLSKSNHKVILLESSPKLGGRAYSFPVEKHDDFVDNGQHVLMGCYPYTLNYLREIGSLDKLYFQKSLELNLVENGGEQLKLGGNSTLYPFNLMYALFSFPRFDLKDKMVLTRFFAKLPFTPEAKLKDLSVEEWLNKTRQTENARKYFWDLLIVGAFNTTAERASALVFREILVEMFLRGNKASTLIIPQTGLSDLYCEPSEKFLREKGNVVKLNERVTSFEIENGRIAKIITNKNMYSGFNYVISAVPVANYLQIRKNGLDENLLEKFEVSPILSIHLWLNNYEFNEKFYGFTGSFLHWLFVHEKHITLVTSNATELIKLPKEIIRSKVTEELSKYFPDFTGKNVKDILIIKEKRATFVSSLQFERARNSVKAPYKNLVFAGDWTNTKLPSTIESAVKSGKTAADKIEKLIKSE